ncbi:MAG: DUF4139 domain-containing protein [Deltaproteobacteria bacterium]|nr:DUF4139 domain-containing protein [Deltaproteobacteria bacterium]
MSARINEVHVFIDRAAVTRRADLTGERTLTISPLPLDTDPAALDVRAFDESGQPLPVISTGLRPISLDRTPERRAIDHEIKKIDQKLAAIELEKATDARSRGWLAEYATIATETLSREWLEKEASFEAWESSLDSLRGAWTDSHARAAHWNHLAEDLTRERASLCETKSRLGDDEPIGLEAVITLDAAEGVTGFVELVSTTPSAQWMPTYEARLDEATGALELSATALVKNATGEAWTNVALIATTARPQLTAPLPELQRAVLSAERSRANGLTASERTNRRLQPGTGGREQTEVAYRAPDRVTLAASGEAVGVPLFSVQIPAKARLLLAPAESTVSSWVAEVANTSDKILLPGQVSIFRGAAYAGRADIGFVVPGQRFLLAIGHDASLRVQRRAVRDTRKAKMTAASVLQFIGGKNGTASESIASFTTTTEIENPGDRPVSVTLRDRVPVSRSDTVKVTVTERPPDLEIDSETGLTTLELLLGSRERRHLQVSYRIEVDSGHQVPLPETL